MRARFLLFGGAALQLSWLLAIGATGTATHSEKLLPLLVYSTGCFIVAAGASTRVMSGISHWAARLLDGEWRTYALLSGITLGVGGVYASLQLGWPDEPAIHAASQMVTERGASQFLASYEQVPVLGKQHPPLVPLVYGFTQQFWGGALFPIRFVSLLCATGVLLLTYRLGAVLYERRTGLLAAGCLLAMPFFFRIGATALLDMPATFAFVGATLLALRLQDRPSWPLAVAVGLCIGAGLLCRYTVALVYPLVLAACVLGGRFRRVAPYLAVALLVSFCVFGTWIDFAVSQGIFAAQHHKVSRVVRYVTGTDRGRVWLLKVLLFRLPSGVGVYNALLLLWGGRRVVQRAGRSDQFVLVWIGAVFLPLALTVPGPRYFLPAFPALAIVAARALERLSGGADRVMLLSLLYGGGALYLFVDWYQAAGGWFTR